MPRVRQNSVKYEISPFIEQALANTTTRLKTIVGENGTSYGLLRKDTGELAGNVFFAKRYEVDNTDFVKIYADGINALLGLSAAGLKVFMVIYQEMMKKENYQAIKIYLDYDILNIEYKMNFTKVTWNRGINDLIAKRIIAETIGHNLFWINIDYFFRGKRLVIMKEYVNSSKEKQLSLPGMEEEELPQNE